MSPSVVSPSRNQQNRHSTKPRRQSVGALCILGQSTLFDQIDVGHHDMGTFHRQPLAGRTADARSAAGDQRDLVAEGGAAHSAAS